MKTYQYKIITLYNGAMINEFEFNDLGKEGFRVVSHVSIPGIYSPDDSHPPPPQYEQFLMEKESGQGDL